MLLSLPSTLTALLTTFLSSSSPPPPPPSLTFHLRHHHALTNDSRTIFADVFPTLSTLRESALTIPLHPSPPPIPRPRSISDFHLARLNPHSFGPLFSTTPALDWDPHTPPSPDLTKRSTLLHLAQMTFNAYAPDNRTASEWYDLSHGGWRSVPYGWDPEADGMRGHVFVSSDNTTVVVSIKGTSAPWLVGGGGPTVGRDKKNDNLLFSCCCARVGPTWATVCGCYEGGYKCDSACVEEALVDESLFYATGLDLYNNVSYMYPHANIWLTGHSLGGGLASLLGATFGTPVVAFEAPAERLASRRLHLPSPPSTHHITHVYHNADPIPMGVCTGVTSLCAIGGFALETRCHLGKVILYDTIQQLGWSVDARNHPIRVVIEKILADGAEYRVPREGEGVRGWGWGKVLRWGWGGKDKDKDKDKDGEEGDDEAVPPARDAVEIEGVDGECTDCYNWEFGDFRDADVGKGKSRL